MTDIVTTCPSLSTSSFTHLIPSLERHAISVADLITLDTFDVARRAQLPPKEVRRLVDALLENLHAQLGLISEEASLEKSADYGSCETTMQFGKDSSKGSTISLLSKGLDEALAGGIRTAAITEITGESSTAKTQFLLTLLLAVQMPVCDGGLGRSAVYICSESALATSRLSQILSSHSHLKSVDSTDKPSLARVLSITVPDLEAQEHILRYQLPVVIQRYQIGLVVIDSITANYRAEIEQNTNSKSGPSSMAVRAASLQITGRLLRSLAQRHNLAVVVANQVADRFERSPNVHLSVDGLPAGSMHSDDGYLADAAMSLDHQQRFFTGWGDIPGLYAGLKTPSLGLVWANQLDCRIALTRAPRHHSVKRSGSQEVEKSRWRRWMKVVFSTWAPDNVEERGIEFEVTGSGISALSDLEHSQTVSTINSGAVTTMPAAAEIVNQI